jgi:hypothetical protein
MRSDVVDQLFSTYLKQPVKASWEGSPSDLLRGSFAEARIELGGIATAWLPLEGVVLSARHIDFQAGMPARIRVEEPRLTAIVGQRDVDRWLSGTQLPFELKLMERGIVARAEVAGLNVAEIEVQLEVLGGWFILQPRRASLLGIPNYVAWLFRTYLPLPPLAKGARFEEIGHEPGRLRLAFEVDGFEEDLTPGLLGRLQERVLP